MDYRIEVQSSFHNLSITSPLHGNLTTELHRQVISNKNIEIPVAKKKVEIDNTVSE